MTDVVREAACQEIIRRHLIAQCDYKKGRIEYETLERIKLLMDELSLFRRTGGGTCCLAEYAEKKRNCDERYVNVVVMAMEMKVRYHNHRKKLQTHGRRRCGHTQFCKISQRDNG